MNLLLISSFLLRLLFARAQMLVKYKPTNEIINNPERGFYRSTETHSASYEPLDLFDLQNFKAQNFTLILREFFLEDFVNSDISSSYLSGMKDDFNIIRTSGLKSIVRFAYSNDQNVANRDASKSRILSHISQVTPLLKAYEDVIAFFQAGFIGTWGEWYFTNNFGDVANLKQVDYADRKQVVEAILAALPNTRMVQVRTPILKQKMYGTTIPLSQSQAFSGTSLSRIGQHNDCFLASADDYGTYEDVSKEYPWLEQETKFTPMGGETCGVYKPRSECASAMSEMQRFHWSYLNYDYHPDVIKGFETGNCYNTILNKLGYRFELVDGNFPQAAKIGTILTFTINILNSGYASVYNKRTAYLVLRNNVSNKEYSFALKTDPRFWMSGTYQKISESITLPSTIIAGSYNLFLNLPDSSSLISSRPDYSIRLANAGIWEKTTGYNNLLHNLTITN